MCILFFRFPKIYFVDQRQNKTFTEDVAEIDDKINLIIFTKLCNSS